MFNSAYVNGRRQAIALSSMNLRAVISLFGVSYVSPPRHKPSVVGGGVSARFQPRNPSGQFVTFAELWSEINGDYARTAFDYDILDQGEQYWQAGDDSLFRDGDAF